MAEETAAPAVSTVTEMPAELVDPAKAAGWPEELVLELLSQGAASGDLVRYMTSGVTEEQVRQFMASQGGDGVSSAGLARTLPASGLK